jgi:hypothetical protein
MNVSKSWTSDVRASSICVNTYMWFSNVFNWGLPYLDHAWTTEPSFARPARSDQDRDHKPKIYTKRNRETCDTAETCDLYASFELLRIPEYRYHNIQIFYTVLSGGIIVQRCICAIPMQSVLAVYLFFVCLYMKRFRVLLIVRPVLQSFPTESYVR